MAKGHNAYKEELQHTETLVDAGGASPATQQPGIVNPLAVST